MDIPNNVTGTTSTSTASATVLPDDWSVTDVRAIADAAAAAKKKKAIEEGRAALGLIQNAIAKAAADGAYEVVVADLPDVVEEFLRTKKVSIERLQKRSAWSGGVERIERPAKLSWLGKPKGRPKKAAAGAASETASSGFSEEKDEDAAGTGEE